MIGNVPRPAEELVGELGRGEPLRRRARPTRRSTGTPSATWRRMSTGPPISARRWTRSSAPRTPRACAATRMSINEDPVERAAALPRHRVRAVDLGRRRDALGAVQGRRLPARSRCAIWPSSRATDDLVLATHGRGIWIVDDITPLRALTPRAAGAGRRVRVGAPGPAAHRGAGRLGRTATPPSSARIPPAGAVITYYQRTRHLFGKLKHRSARRERRSVIDELSRQAAPRPQPRRLDHAPASRRTCPPAAQLAFAGTQQGPRVLPGIYTVRTGNGRQDLRSPKTPRRARPARRRAASPTGRRSTTRP